MSPAAKGAVIAIPLVSVIGCLAGDDDAAVFERDRMHTIVLVVDETDLTSLESDLEGRVACTMRFDGGKAIDAKIRQKGNTAVSLSSKPSFSVKLEDSLHGLDKILLDSGTQDPTLLRELIGADTFARAGLPAARAAHAIVRLNGVDKGIYVISEAIDTGFLARRFGSDDDGGNLYEGPCCGDFVDVDHMELDDAEGRSRSDLEALRDIVIGAADEDLAAALDARLDVDAYLSHYALEAILGHWDGYAYRTNNFYLYDNPADGRFVFLPHGMDRILEDASFDPETTPRATLPMRVRSIPTLDARFRVELARLVEIAWEETAVLAGIEAAAAVLHTSTAGTQTLADLAGFDAAVGGLRALVSQRRALFDPSVRCGDGDVAGFETCDDGNTTNGDGCSSVCRVEP